MNRSHEDAIDDELRAYLGVRAEELAREMLRMHDATDRLARRSRAPRDRRARSLAMIAATVAGAALITVAVVGGRPDGEDGQRRVGSPSSTVEAIARVVGIYRSVEPLRGTMCVAVSLEPEAATTDLWWWGAGKTGCDSRTSDVIRTLAFRDVVGGPRGEVVKVSYLVDLMTGEQERIEFTIGSAPAGAPLPALITDRGSQRELVMIRTGDVEPPFRPVD